MASALWPSAGQPSALATQSNAFSAPPGSYLDAASAASAIQEDSALLIQYRYMRSLPPVVAAPALSGLRDAGASSAGVGLVKQLSAGGGFNLARAIRARASISGGDGGTPLETAGGPGDNEQLSRTSSAGAIEVAYLPSPKGQPVDPTTLLQTVSTIVLTYEAQGQPLLAMEALQLGGALSIDLARERQQGSIASATKVGAQRASVTVGGDRADMLFGGGNDRAEMLFGGGGGGDRADQLFAGAGGGDRADLLFSGGTGDRADLLFSGGTGDRADLLFAGDSDREHTSYGGTNVVGGSLSFQDHDLISAGASTNNWQTASVAELADADPALGHAVVCDRICIFRARI